MKTIKILFLIVLLSFKLFSQSNYQAPTLSAGLDNIAFKKGTLDVEILAKIIAEKQKELIREGIKRTIYRSIGESKKLDDFTQFYIERVVDIIFNEKNHQVITKRVLEETTNYLFILGTTKYILESKNDAIKNIFLDDEKFPNLDDNIVETNITINKNHIKEKLESIKNRTTKNAIIKTILTICKEITLIKKLGLLNDFNYLEHTSIYNKSLTLPENNLLELISLEDKFDFKKIDSISINNFQGNLKDFLKNPTDNIPDYLLKNLNVKKCLSLLKVYKTIKDLVGNSSILKDITSKSGIKFNSVEKDLTEVIKNYEKLNVFSFDDDQLIFSSKNKNLNKININNLISHYKTMKNEIERFKKQSKNLTDKLTEVANFNYSYIYNNKSINYNILKNTIVNQPKEKIIQVANQIANSRNKNFILQKTENFIDKNAIDSIIAPNKIDLLSLESQVNNLKECKNFFYVEKIIEERDIINKYSDKLSKLDNHQTFFNDYLKIKNDLINKPFNETIDKINSKYYEIRKLYKLSEALLYSYKYLIKNTDTSLKSYIDTILLEEETNAYIIERLTTSSLIDPLKIKKYSVESFIKLLINDINNTKIKNINFTINLGGTYEDEYTSIEDTLIQIGNKISLGDFYKKKTYDLYLEIKKLLNNFNFETKENSTLTDKESKLLKKLYQTFSDRNLQNKVENLSVLQDLNDDFLSELRVLSNKIKKDSTNKTSLNKIINSINFSNTKLLIEKTKENKKFLSPKIINNVLSFLKFIGNIKEFNKAETFTFLLQTMDDYKGLLNFDKENLRIIPDLINSLRTYSIIDYDKNIIEIDVASVLIHLLEKYQQKSDVLFYATVGVNQFFIPNYNKQKPEDTNYNYGMFSAASEKIGAKWKVIDWNNKYYKPTELIHEIRRKAYVSDYYVMAYVSGILYKIANTSGRNYDDVNIGLATGFTFFNSLDFNVSVSIPFNENPFQNYLFGFSFDIPLSEYLKRL